jgi:glycosyltransferase involved in cell wall biosynthesis
LVSVIIPARNEEASIARAVESVAMQPEVGEVIVVNDDSTDATGAILADLAARYRKLSVLDAGPLPEGWVGKNHAASVGAAAAEGHWLLFTDADTYHYPGSTRRALLDAVDHDAALVSYSPEQEMETWWERAVIPFVFCRLAATFSFARVNDPRRPDAAANGQFLMIRRDVYESVGGHSAVAPQILEDVALAETVKNAGHAIYFFNPAGVVRTRMYRSFGALWEGWTKNLYPLFGDDGRETTREIVTLFAIAILCGICFSVLGLRSHPTALYWSTTAVVLIWVHVAYAFALRRNHFPVRLIEYLLIGGWLYMILRGVSWWKNTHGKIVWKGREYAAKMP